MFSKDESRQLRQGFWTAFGKSYPRKWILYNTKVKGLVFRFHFDLTQAMVSMDVEHNDLETRINAWEKVNSLKSILKEEFLPEAIFEDYFLLKNGKEISRVYIKLKEVSIHNKDTWLDTMVFLNKNMRSLEEFFMNYEDVLAD